ncbi:MAG: MBL fold metallo-hydrolase [Candidatus Thorarchaeota archaeon]
MATVDIKKKGTGFILSYGDVKLALDTVSDNASTLLSHSHADHIGGIKEAKHVVATSGTLKTLAARGINLKCELTVVKHNDIFGQIGVNIMALNAGHVLGSTMFLIEFDDGLSVLYTGDFNTVDSIVHKAAQPIEADVLITEATYGTPEWVFPDRTTVHNQILEKVRETIENGRIALCRAYSLGKAQEAIALLQQTGFPVISGNKSISSVSKVYTEHGKDLRYLRIVSDDISDALREGCAIVSSYPKHTFNFIRRSGMNNVEDRCDIYNLSGWTLSEIGGNGFPLSAHTDFPGLLKFVKEVGPRIAYCFTRNGRVLSNHLNESGIHSVPLE